MVWNTHGYSVKGSRRRLPHASLSIGERFSSSLCRLNVPFGIALPSEGSFGRPLGPQEPSLLDYSQEHEVFAVPGASSCIQGLGRNSIGVALQPAELTAASRIVSRVGNGGRSDEDAGECGTSGCADGQSGQDTRHAGRRTPPLHRITDEGATTTTTRNTTAVCTVFSSSSSSEADDDAVEAPKSEHEPQRNPTARDNDGAAGSGEGAVADTGGGGESSLDSISAKVKTRRSPRRKLPDYLSASPDRLGAASRWGALSKAHLEFHRLGTAGECRGESGTRVQQTRFIRPGLEAAV